MLRKGVRLHAVPAKFPQTAVWAVQLAIGGRVDPLCGLAAVHTGRAVITVPAPGLAELRDGEELGDGLAKAKVIESLFGEVCLCSEMSLLHTRGQGPGRNLQS